MIQQGATDQSERKEVAGKSSEHAASSKWSAHLTDACANAIEALDAQMDICTLKTTRVIFLLALGLLSAVAMTILAGYGFYLLDSCFEYALSRPSMPIWFGALIRGTLYLGGPVVALLYLWRYLAGGSVNSSSNQTS